MNLPMLYSTPCPCKNFLSNVKKASVRANFNSIYILLVLILSSCTNYTEVGKPLPGINLVKKGETFFINLPENHADHFMWKLNDDFDKNLLEHINAVWHGNEKGVDYHFKAKQNGQDTLNFTLYKYNEVSRYISFVVKAD